MAKVDIVPSDVEVRLAITGDEARALLQLLNETCGDTPLDEVWSALRNNAGNLPEGRGIWVIDDTGIWYNKVSSV